MRGFYRQARAGWFAISFLMLGGCAGLQSSETFPTTESLVEPAKRLYSEASIASATMSGEPTANASDLEQAPFADELFSPVYDSFVTPQSWKEEPKMTEVIPQKTIVQVAYEEELLEPFETEQLPPELPIPPPDFEEVPQSTTAEKQMPLSVEEPFVIDLGTALRLGGADALQIHIAREKAYQAQVEWTKSRLLLLPTLWYGVGWNHHDGQIQHTRGNVTTNTRSSLYTGAGAGFEGAPVTGGNGGPGQFVLNLSLADVYFEPLEKMQHFQAATAAKVGETNNTLLEIGIAYADILEARSELANNHQGLEASQNLVQLTTHFADAGQGAAAEVYRAKAEAAQWLRKVDDAQRRSIRNTAELARLLRLSSDLQLVPAEQHLVPVAMVEESLALDGLIATGLAARPELAEYQALAEARLVRFRQETFRPFLPYIQLAGSVGAFGGSEGTSIDNMGIRDDLDALAIWEFRNLGLGNYLLKRRSKSEYIQSQLKVEALQNQVIADIIKAATDVAGFRRQMEAAKQGIKAANTSYELNLDLIRNAAGLPLELVQSINARTDAKNAYTEAISNYNRAQYRLMHAMGQPAALALPQQERATP